MINLRGHHLLCSATFAGQGYSRQFEQDFHAILKRMQAGEAVRIVNGPDDLCRSVKDLAGSHCHEARITERDALALQDISRLLGRQLTSGDVLDSRQLYTDALKTGFRNHTLRSACFNCQWSSLCDSIAQEDFEGSVLFGQEGKS